MRFKFKGKRWAIETVGHIKEFGKVIWGERLVLIHRDQKGRERLGTRIHELLHVACPYLEEEAVASTEKLLTKVLWKMGYRCPEDQDEGITEIGPVATPAQTD